MSDALPWTKFYGALPERFCPPSDTMLSLFRATVAGRADREALRYFGTLLSWREIDRLSDALARAFAAKGIGRESRVGIILQNVPASWIATIAVWKLGAVPVAGNPMYRAGELAKIFADYRPRLIVAHCEHAPTVREALDAAALGPVPIVTVAPERDGPFALAEAVPRVAGSDDFDALLAGQLSRGAFTAEACAGQDLGLILYTSGTTGQPKGVMISHANLAFTACNSAPWFRVDAESRILALAPLFHITGFALHLCLAVATGCSTAMHYRFDPAVVIEVIRAYRPTFTIAAITAFNALMHAEGVSREDFACFDHVCSGGAPIAPSLRDAVRERLGVVLHPVYGMSETTSPTHAVPPGAAVPVDHASGALSVGIPMSSTRAMIADEQGQALPANEVGEICMRGPQIMQGYLDKPGDTAEALRDGWMHSGDVGFMDRDGWFYVIDRKKDVINASGFKVWPREVEDALYAHPAIREAAVVGRPDSYRGETVVAYVSLKDGHAADPEDMKRHCSALLAAYKVPRSIVVVDDLPKTATGKIQRAALRERG